MSSYPGNGWGSGSSQRGGSHSDGNPSAMMNQRTVLWGSVTPLRAQDERDRELEQQRVQQQQRQQQTQQQQQQQHQNDVAGVLRRNQACLACRRRKLKCDAIRPHCSTCVRSHKHMARTAPHTNPVLSCDYDDGNGPNERPYQPPSPHSASPVEEEGETNRKKRKSNAGEGGKKKRDTEAERLKKRIEELEAKLAGDSGSSSVQDQINSATQSRRTSDARYPPPISTSQQFNRGEAISAESPTSFLDMLSAAATEQAPGAAGLGSAGLRAGVNGTAMMNGATGTYIPPPRPAESPYHTGFTPSFSYGGVMEDSRPQPVHQVSAESSVSGHSVHASISPYDNSGPSEPIALTPSGVFNFSPGPPEPVNYESMPLPDANGMIQPSTRPSGPWMGIETVETLLGAAHAKGPGQYMNIPGDQIPIDPMLDPSMMPPPMEIPRGVPMETYAQPVEVDLQQQMLMDLFWPGWPPALPEPHIVNELIDVFFDRVSSLPRMLLRSRFMTRMTLPPTHSNFPHPSLLHSICAIAVNWCAPAIYEASTVARKLNGKSGSDLSFSAWQSGLAKEMVHDGLNTGSRMFDVVRAMMILSRLFIDDTRMLECWAYHGLVARMILPLGLNVRSAELSLKSVMLPPPQDSVEREERRGAMWFAFYHDTVSSAASGWGSSIALDELTVPLPCSVKDFESGLKDIPSNPQDAESSDLFTHHPVVDPFVLCLKACIIMNRVTRFARKWKNRHLREDDDFAGMQRPEFRELANNIACLQMSFPYELRNPCQTDNQRKIDIDLIVAHMLPFAATIILYEPFADVTDSSDAAARRILAAAQAIVGIVQQLATAAAEGTSNALTVMHSAASICLVTAARTSLLFYRNALNIGDERLAASLRSDVEMNRMALEQFGLRFKIGHHHAQLVAYFLDRATYPTYEKLISHYPDHPRPGAPPLTPNSDFGICVLNALNIKRGFWRIKRDQVYRTNSNTTSAAGRSPFETTPGSSGNGNGDMPMPQGCSGGFGGARFETESPQHPYSGLQSVSGNGGGSGVGSGSWSNTMADTSVGQAEGLTEFVGVQTSGPGIGQSRSASTSSSSKAYPSGGNIYEIQPDGSRPVFGKMRGDGVTGVGVTLMTPGDAFGGGPTGVKQSSTELEGGKRSEEYTAQSAAWFLAPEPGGQYRGSSGAQ